MKINPQAAFATVQTGLDALDTILSQALRANDDLYKENLRLTDESKKKDGEIDLLKQRIAQLESENKELSILVNDCTVAVSKMKEESQVEQATRQIGAPAKIEDPVYPDENITSEG